MSQDNSDRKQIRFGHELLDLINKARGDTSLGAYVKQACKSQAIQDLTNQVDTHKEKVCKSCGTTKPLSDFAVDKSKPSGRVTKCKTCKAQYDKERNAK